MKIRTMLLCGFAAVVMLCVLTGFWGLNGTSNYKLSTEKTMQLANLCNILKSIEVDHFKWASLIGDAFLNDEATLNVQTDYRLCGLGKFLYGAYLKEVRGQFPKIAERLDKIKEPHTRLHNSAKNIEEKWKQSQKTSNEAKLIFQTKTAAALGAVQKAIANTTDLAKEMEEQLNRDQNICYSHQEIKIISVVIISAIVAIGIGLWTTFRVTAPIKKTIEFSERLNKGDLSVSLDMGNAVNCSQIMGCNRLSCPSYGKKSNCWVEAGSFSNHPVCPHAVKGEDCRICKVYRKGNLNEFAEMGSCLNAVVDELKIKAGIAAAIGKGDLFHTVHVVSETDTLGMALQDMTINLNDIIGQLYTVVSQVDMGAKQVSDSSQSLSQGATEQASSIEEVTASMSEISSQTKTNSENASQANVLALKARDAGQVGAQQMQEMVDAMESINASSREIRKIIKVIDDIAFQTNLLALNAAVEAARAGKYGKGFAVVAQEVRTLAARSSRAAQETSELISGTGKKIQIGSEIAAKTAKALEEINQGITKATDLVSEINAASNEQTIAISQINQGLSQIDIVTQQNTVNAEESSSSAEELSSQTTQVRMLLDYFKLEDATGYHSENIQSIKCNSIPSSPLQRVEPEEEFSLTQCAHER